MRLLAIECATEACSLALFEDGQLLAASHEVLGRGHAERLVPLIAALPCRGKADQILVSLGPGSFTGTRIGLAAARALGVAWGARVEGYPTLALVAAMAAADHSAPLAVVMAGGHGEYFLQSFGADGRADGEALSLAPKRAVAMFAHDLVVGNRASAFVAARGLGRAVDLLPDARAAHLLHQADLVEALRPIYGRPADARLPG